MQLGSNWCFLTLGLRIVLQLLGFLLLACRFEALKGDNKGAYFVRLAFTLKLTSLSTTAGQPTS